MSTKIDIASNALILIGDEPISSFDETGAGATAAANLYEATYQKVLAFHPWSFAMKEQRLSRLSQSPEPETNYKYAYQIPVDMIKIWAVLPHSNYAIVGDKLYSNSNTLLMRYLYRVDEQAIPPQVVKAIEYALASDFAMLVTESTNKAQYYEQKYRDQVALASSSDSQNRPQTAIVDSPFIRARLSGEGFS